MSHTELSKRMEKIKKSAMNDDERDRVSRIIELQQDMLSVRTDELDRWEDNIKRQQFEKDSLAAVKAKDGRSNIRIPLEFAFVESKTADEIATLPFPKVLPTEPSDIEAAAEFQQVFDFVLDNVLNIKEILFRMSIHKNTLGDSILKPYWYTETREIQKPIVKKNKDGISEISFKKEKITVYDDIKIDLVDIRQFLIDPIVTQAGKKLEDAMYCEFVSVYEIEAFKLLFKNRPGYKNIDMVTPSTRVTDQSARSRSEENGDIRSDMVEVIEHWDVLNDELTVVAGDIEIRNTPIPYFNPVTGVKSLPIAHFIGHYKITGFYNFSEIDIIKDLAEERQTQRNINIDAAKSYTHPFLAIGGMNDFDVDEFVWGVNSVAEVEDVSQIKQFSMAGNSGLPFSLESANQQDAIVVTGNDVTGILPIPGQTATETLEKKEAGIKRTRMTTSYNEMNGYRRLYSLIKDLILQFYGPTDADRITKPGRKKKPETVTFRGATPDGEATFFEINREILGKDYDIMVVSNNQIPASKEIKKLRDQEALGTIGALPFNPETGQLPKHLVPAVKKVLQNMEIPDEEIKAVLGEEPEVEAPTELDAALQGVANEGISIEGVESPEGGPSLEQALAAVEAEGIFTRGGTPPKGKEGGIQETIQQMTPQ